MNHDRAPNRRRALLGLVLLPTVAGASAVLSGCRSPAGRTSTASASATVDASGPQLVTSRDDLVSPRPEAWESWTLVSPDTIEVSFWGLPAQCQAIYVELIETDDDVTINLTIGDPSNGTQCDAVTTRTWCRVTLSRELGDRQVRQDNA
mgnify:CR=1 FL=1|jgi:lipoprotein